MTMLSTHHTTGQAGTESPVEPKLGGLLCPAYIALLVLAATMAPADAQAQLRATAERAQSTAVQLMAQAPSGSTQTSGDYRGPGLSLVGRAKAGGGQNLTRPLSERLRGTQLEGYSTGQKVLWGAVGTVLTVAYCPEDSWVHGSSSAGTLPPRSMPDIHDPLPNDRIEGRYATTGPYAENDWSVGNRCSACEQLTDRSIGAFLDGLL